MTLVLLGSAQAVSDPLALDSLLFGSPGPGQMAPDPLEPYYLKANSMMSGLSVPDLQVSGQPPTAQQLSAPEPPGPYSPVSCWPVSDQLELALSVFDLLASAQPVPEHTAGLYEPLQTAARPRVPEHAAAQTTPALPAAPALVAPTSVPPAAAAAKPKSAASAGSAPAATPWPAACARGSGAAAAWTPASAAAGP